MAPNRCVCTYGFTGAQCERGNECHTCSMQYFSHSSDITLSLSSIVTTHYCSSVFPKPHVLLLWKRDSMLNGGCFLWLKTIPASSCHRLQECGLLWNICMSSLSSEVTIIFHICSQTTLWGMLCLSKCAVFVNWRPPNLLWLLSGTCEPRLQSIQAHANRERPALCMVRVCVFFVCAGGLWRWWPVEVKVVTF